MAASALIGIFTSHTRLPVLNESFASRSDGIDACKKKHRKKQWARWSNECRGIKTALKQAAN
jgi:hypothetical protein